MQTWDEVQRQLEEARNFWLCTTTADGRPHVAPVWGLWMNDAFYFSTDPSSRKGRDIAEQPRVVVHLESGDDVVILEGSAERVSDAAFLSHFVDLYEQKYAIRFDPTNESYGVYAVRPRTGRSWTERDFPATATRWTFPSH